MSNCAQILVPVDCSEPPDGTLGVCESIPGPSRAKSAEQRKEQPAGIPEEVAAVMEPDGERLVAILSSSDVLEDHIRAARG